MSTAVNKDIRKALYQAVVNCGLGIPVAGDNMPFDKPTPPTPWAAARILPGQASAVTLGGSGEDEHRGILQLDLNYGLRLGEAELMEKIGVVAGYFVAGLKLTYGSTVVYIRSCSRSQGREVDGWWRVSISVVWWARHARGELFAPPDNPSIPPPNDDPNYAGLFEDEVLP